MYSLWLTICIEQLLCMWMWPMHGKVGNTIVCEQTSSCVLHTQLSSPHPTVGIKCDCDLHKQVDVHMWLWIMHASMIHTCSFKPWKRLVIMQAIGKACMYVCTTYVNVCQSRNWMMTCNFGQRIWVMANHVNASIQAYVCHAYNWSHTCDYGPCMRLWIMHVNINHACKSVACKHL